MSEKGDMDPKDLKEIMNTMSTEIPKLHRPRSSGGVTWINAASNGSCPELNRRGISDRKMGV